MPDQEAILKALRRHLHSHPEIVFAYVHGSLVDGVPYNDVDVAVYVRPEWFSAHRSEILSHTLDLSTKLTIALRQEIELNVPIDVQILNNAPLQFQLHVVRDGQLLFTRDDEMLVDFIERTARRAMDMELLWKTYREALIEP